MMKRLFILIPVICLCIFGCSKNSSTKLVSANINKEEGTNFIAEYIKIRYEGVNTDNIEERYAEQEGFYSVSMRESPLWANLPDNIDASKRFFESRDYQCQILRNQISSDDNSYRADFSVLYLSNDYAYDCYVDYIIVFELCEENGIKIESMNTIKNQTIYIHGAEIHVLPDKVELIYPDIDSDMHE